MQADEFEKKIQNKMEGFGLVPDNEVWKQVSARIKKEKTERRVLFYWLLTGFVFLAGTSAWWFINNENNRKLVIKDVNHAASKEVNDRLKQSINNSSPGFYKPRAETKKSIAFIQKDKIKQKFTSEVKNKALTKIKYAEVIKELNVNRGKDNRKAYKAESQSPRSLPPHRFYTPELTATVKVDTSIKNNSIYNKKTNFTNGTATNTIVKETIQTKRQRNKKWNAGFTVYSGISDNLSGLPLLEKNYALDYYSSPDLFSNENSSQIGNYNYNINTSNNFKRAFSFGLGFFVKKQLTQRMSLSGGIDLHSYRAKSMVGRKVNQQRSFYDSSEEKALSVNGFYTVGNSVTYSNKYQLLELPINLALQLNKNRERPLLISAGISPGLLLSSNALYANPSANVYYVDKEKFHHFQLSVQSGLMFTVSGTNKYSLTAGPVVQYGFINPTKAVIAGSQHLFFSGLKANIIFK